MKSRMFLATFAMLVAASSVVAGEEPFGMAFDGEITQEDRKVLCRAILGQNITARFTEGKMEVSLPAGKVPAGSYPETHLNVGGTSEPVDAKSDGKRFCLNSDANLLDKACNRPRISLAHWPDCFQHVHSNLLYATMPTCEPGRPTTDYPAAFDIIGIARTRLELFYPSGGFVSTSTKITIDDIPLK